MATRCRISAWPPPHSASGSPDHACWSLRCSDPHPDCPNSRRRALALALSGVLVLRGLARPDDATAGGTCKPKCAECKKCKKGKNGKKGKCKPKAEGTECSTGTCQSGSCVAPAICTNPPSCSNGSDCCSGSCV